MPTYYYPSENGTGEFFAPGTNISTAGTANFQGTNQAAAGSYSVVTPLGGTGPGGALQYQVTFGYTGPGTGTTIITTQTNYSDSTGSETYGQFPVTDNGVTTTYPAYFILTNGPVSPGYSHTFSSAGSNTVDNFTATDGTTSDPTVCFAAGTLIRTARGDIAVEQLVPGDEVFTAAGEFRLIRWLGHRTIDFRGHPRRAEAMPIRIAKHAFGENRPTRDLFVSPGHAICVNVVDEVLIPVSSLINGSTIQQVEVDTVTYWHVELDSHDIILAENLPAESYLDMGNRGFFKEADVVDLVPDVDPSQRTHANFCRPFHAAGPLVEVVRSQLQKRAETAGWQLSSAIEIHLEVDGKRFDPLVRGLTARFQVPANSKDVWLVAPVARPSVLTGSGDNRDLGLCIGGLRIDDGFEIRDIALDDPLLGVGFHEVEDGRRWTAGRAKLPIALWDGCKETFFLRVDLAGSPVPRWIAAPATETVAATERQMLAVA